MESIIKKIFNKETSSKNFLNVCFSNIAVRIEENLGIFILSGIIVLSSSFIQSNNSVPGSGIAYNANEDLSYLMYYGFIDGGEATMKLERRGENTIYASAKAKTVGLVSKIIPINDTYSSYFDEKTGKPIKAIRDIKEGKYTSYTEVSFDHKNNKVKSSKTGTVSVPSNIFDILSAFYYARNHVFPNLKQNDSVVIQTYFDDEIFPLVLVYNGKETVSTKCGKFNAHKFTPLVETGRAFKESDDMRIWVSADKNFIPLRIEFDLILGSIKCDLVKYSGIKNKLAKIE